MAVSIVVRDGGRDRLQSVECRERVQMEGVVCSRKGSGQNLMEQDENRPLKKMVGVVMVVMRIRK